MGDRGIRSTNRSQALRSTLPDQPPGQPKGVAMHRTFAVLDAALNHPLTKILVAICLVITAGMEILHEVERPESPLGAHHGVFVYGVAMAISALAEVGAAALEAHEAAESRHNQGR